MAGFLPLRAGILAAALAVLGPSLPAGFAPLRAAPADDAKALSAEDKAALAAAEKEQRRQHDEAVKQAVDDFKKGLREAKNIADRAALVNKLSEAERDPRIQAELARLLGDPAETVRIEVMQALAKYRRDRAAASALAGAVPASSRTASMLAHVLDALGAVGHESALPVVARYVTDKEARVAVAAIRALGEMNSPSAIPLLVETWERLEKEKTKGDDQKRAAEDRLKEVEGPLKEALAALTGQRQNAATDYRAWWNENRATAKPREEPSHALCRHFAPIHVVGGRVTGSILHEVWRNLPGNNMDDAYAALSRPPSSTSTLTSFESPVGIGDDYVTRIRGFLHPPVDGEYVFWISSDDGSALFLSPDESPARKARIAWAPGDTRVKEWGKFGEQKSKPVVLAAGRRYYVEAVHKEGGGDNDHVAVAWQPPGGTREVIPGRVLSPPDAAGAAAPALAARPPAGPVPAPAPASVSAGTGRIAREVWWNVRGGLVEMQAGNRYATAPDESTFLDRFEAPENAGDRYVARVRGFLVPAVSGEHRFWIASDNESELWLSPDDDPANKKRIAGVLGGGGANYTSPRGWAEKPGQQSEPVALAAGRRYYIEAVHAEGEGGDHLAVAWQPPGASGPEVIPGRCLAPIVQVAAAVAAAPAPLSRPGSAFVRGVNLNGPAVTIDGNAWESGAEAENCLVFGRPVRDDVTPLVPPDAAREPMLRTAVVHEGGTLRIVLAGLPAGRCRVCLYTRESAGTVRFDVRLNGAAVEGVSSGPAKSWQRHGPWPVAAAGGVIVVDCPGGAVKVCGVELWRE